MRSGRRDRRLDKNACPAAVQGRRFSMSVARGGRRRGRRPGRSARQAGSRVSARRPAPRPAHAVARVRAVGAAGSQVSAGRPAPGTAQAGAGAWDSADGASAQASARGARATARAWRCGSLSQVTPASAGERLAPATRLRLRRASPAGLVRDCKIATTGCDAPRLETASPWTSRPRALAVDAARRRAAGTCPWPRWCPAPRTPRQERRTGIPALSRANPGGSERSSLVRSTPRSQPRSWKSSRRRP